MGNVDLFRITVNEERHAVALARELIGVSDVDLQRERDRWVVALRARQSGKVVGRVLDAVRRSLAGDPTASALVALDGREFHMQDACVARTAIGNGTGRPSPADAIRRERSGEDIFVVSLAGEHDLYTAPKVQEEFRSVIAAGARAIVVDLTETSFLDSTMLHVLLIARKELREGGRLLVVTNDASIKRVFEISGIDRFFDFFPSRRAAEEEVRSHEPDE
jgi:anti-sigma B factor antagonist